MSLFSALTVAVGGLNAQSASIGNISDNIANAQTVGFKRIDTLFQSLVTQSNANVNDPGGVRATPFYQNALQGNLIQSQNATSLAISGNGFFSVHAPQTGADGNITFSQTDIYTRRGDFVLDKDGYFVNGAGYALLGWPVDSNGTAVKETQEVRVNALIDKPIKTTAVAYAANLPAGADDDTVFAESTIQIYDSLGTQHTMTLKWTKGNSDDTFANTWYLDITPADAVATGDLLNYEDTDDSTDVDDGDPIGTQRLQFVFGDGVTSIGGNVYDSGTIASIDDGGGDGTFFSITADSGPLHEAKVAFNLLFAGAGSQTVTLDFGQYNEADGVTQFDASDLSVTSFEQNGIPQGSFQDLTIDNSGFVYLNYDNGRSRILYQVPLTQFNNPNGLQRETGGAYSRTLASGDPSTRAAGENGNGTIVGNTLEGANVDIADEFTKMIQAQRVYSANARTITTTNSMLEEIINVIR
jgi:flagellar hook protein FlgE